MDAELGHEPVDHPEEADVVVVAVRHQVVEAVGAVGRPVAVDLDHEVALAGLEAGLEDVGGGGGQCVGGEEHGIVVWS